MCEHLLQDDYICEDIKTAASLPNQVFPEVALHLDQYVLEKQQEREDILQAMHDEIDGLNVHVEKEVQQYVETAKEELEIVKNELDKSMLDEITTIEQLIYVSEKNEKRKLKISKIAEELLVDLSLSEKERSDSIRKILSEYKNKIALLMCLSIPDTDKLFGEEIDEINMKMLENLRKHEDLKFQILVNGEDETDKFGKLLKEKAYKVADDYSTRIWNKIRTNQSRKVLRDSMFCLTQENLKAREELMQSTNELAKKLSEFSEGMRRPDEQDFCGELWTNWAGQFTSRLDALDKLCKHVDFLLKKTVATLIENFENQTNNLTRTLFCKLQEPLISRSDSAEREELAAELKALKVRRDKEVEILQNKWQVTIKNLNGKIEQAKVFIEDMTLIWTNHINRVEKLKKETTSNFESAHAAVLKLDKEENGKLKNLMKSTREAKDIKSLNQLQNNLVTKHNDISDMWEDNYEDQLECVEELRRTEVDKLIEEKIRDIHTFLNEKYPKRAWFSSSMASKRAPVDSLEIPPNKDYDQELNSPIGVFETYMTAVENRCLGMYEMLERYVPHCAASVREELETWLNVFLQEVVDLYEGKLSETTSLQHFTVCELVNVRTAEIEIHANRLVSHSKAVTIELADLQKRYDEVKSRQQAMLTSFNEKVTCSIQNLDGKNPLEIKHKISQFETDWILLNNTLENTISEMKTSTGEKFTALKTSNDLFMKTAKTFKNGGNYNQEEIKTLNKQLKMLDKTILNQKKTLMNKINVLNKGISKQIFDEKVEHLRQKLKETSLENSFVDTLDILRMRLRTEVKCLMGNSDTISKEISNFSSREEANVNLVSAIVSSMKEFHSYIIFPSSMSTLECHESREESDKTETVTVKSMKSGKPSENPTKNLFKHTSNGIEFDESNNFFSRTKSLILKKYNTLIKALEERNPSKPGEKGKTKAEKPNVPDLKSNLGLDEHAQKYELLRSTVLSYNSECECVWFYKAREFFNQLSKFRTSVDNLFQHQLEKLHSGYKTNLQRLEKDFVQYLRKEENESMSKRENVYKSLKLPLAHPSQEHRLKDLKEKAYKLCETLRKDYKASIVSYKNQLQSKHDEYVTLVRPVKDTLNDLYESVYDGSEFQELYQILKATTKVIPYQPFATDNSEHSALVETADAKNAVYPISIWSEEDCTKGGLSDKSQGPSNNSFDGQRSVFTLISDTMNISISRIAAENVKDSAETVQELYNQAVNSMTRYEDEVTSWIRQFELDVKQAKQIFISICD